MALGIFLLLIFILYLIDKHNRWRIAAKITAGLVALGILAVGGLFGWEKYDAYRTEKEQEAQALAQIAADAKAHQIAVENCIVKSYAPAPASSKSSADVVKQASAYPADFVAREQRQCDANPDAPLTGFSWSKGEWQEWTDVTTPTNGASFDFGFQPVTPAPKQRHVKAEFDGDLTTTELGSLTCGHFKQSEVATLLDEGTIGIKIKTPEGDVGWAPASAFEVVK